MISILSVRRMGPTLVSQSKVVPAPEVVGEVKRMATASCIQSTWSSTWRTTSQTSAGVASITVLTRMPAMSAC